MIDVHVMVPMDWAYTRQLLLGVRAYSREQSDWRLVIGCDSLSRINRNNAGLIAFVRSPALMAELCEAGIPAVNVSGRLAHSDVPRVMPDQEAIGTVAAEHLLERQHRSFVFVGEPGEFFCDERERGFRRTVERAGCDCVTATLKAVAAVLEQVSKPASSSDRSDNLGSRRSQWIHLYKSFLQSV